MPSAPGQHDARPTPDFARVTDALRGVRIAARRLLLTRAVALLIASLACIFTAAGMLDFVLRFPVWMRTGHLALGAALLVFVFWKWILPAWRFNPPLTSIAMRLERANPQLRDLLASGVEFDRALHDDSQTAHATEMESALSRQVVEQAADAFSDIRSARAVLNSAPAWRAVAMLLASVLIILAAGAANTSLAIIGAQRTLLPWAGAEWPKRTGVADATDISVHPLGVVLPLRAVLTKANRAVDRTDVIARYRPIAGGREGETQRVLLTWQGRDETTSAGDNGAFFERLIEADADAIEYRFETEDDETPWRRILLVEPPAVASASAVITPPDYAGAIPARADASRTELDLGSGADERAIAPPALLGSAIGLTLNFNKPIPIDTANPDWLAATFSPDFAETDAAFDPPSGESRTLRLSWSLAASTRIPVMLVDEHGIQSADDAVFRFDAVEDQPPAATVTAPPSDTAVLATAVIDITGEGRDDVGLAWLRIERQRFRPEGAATGSPSGPGGAMAPADDPAVIADVQAQGQPTIEAAVRLELETLGVEIGDEVQITAIAADVFAAADLSRAPTRSTPRRLRIVSEEEFVQAIRNELSGVRQSVMRIDDRQREARDHAQQEGADQTAIKEQASITDRVAREVESIEQIQSRLDQNRLDDERLDNLLSSVRQSLEQARSASTRAADALDQLAERQEAQDNPEAQQGAARNTEDAQREVMDRLEDVAAQLDTGEDAWVLQRGLEKMLEAQRALQQRTDALSAKTAGKTAGELSEQERSELEQIVEAQEQLAQQADELTDEMRQREQQLRETDQTAAAGLAEAARRAREERLSQTMEQAAGEAQQNQTSSASQSQQQAAESLERMLQDLEEGQRAREAALRRILASLIESLEALINQQNTQLAALSQSIIENAPLGALDQGMIRLNTNTLAVVDLARNAGRELAPVASLVTDASEAQSRAVVELRRAEINPDAVRAAEARSLDLLQRALEEANRLDDQMQQQEQQRKKAELLKAYRDALAAQIALRDEAAAYEGRDELSRRDRAALRGVADEQETIGGALDMILESTEELADAEVFTFAHKRLSALSADAAENLRNAAPTPAVRRQTAAIAVLQGIVESLQEQAPPRDDNFNDGGGGSSGSQEGQQQQDLLPPLAQLRLLRQMQADLLDRTRLSDDLPNEPGVDSPTELGAEQRQLGQIGGAIIEKMSQSHGEGPGERPIQPQ
ncbi:MAG: hypothetical protein H6813_04275 [Phycisphaeraceae bacterium]|nr:hypothetical protein [Phycisphaeraceae bacterium]MCB9847164.1 hypothetical protein [Phycisphaeraceae bacterium]